MEICAETGNVSPVEPLRLVYVIGTYPELTNTFIDREIGILRELGGFEICILSLRFPHTINTYSPQQRALHSETLYLIPEHWTQFRLATFIFANLYFLLLKPGIYISTFFQLLRGDHPNLKARIKTLIHFLMGVFAAYLLREMQFEHLHAHFMDRSVIVSFTISRLLSKTYSFTAHAADIYIKPVLMRLKLLHASFVITVSKFNREHLAQIDPYIQKNKIFVLHPWVNPDEFIPHNTLRNSNKFNILSVGRLVEKKGHRDLIQACQILREHGLEFECRILGGGPLHQILESQITQQQLHEYVKLEGDQPQQRVRDLLGYWANVFVLPCVIAGNGDRDGMPVSIAEAMAMSLPVISTNIIGIGELVHSGAGILVQPHNPRDLSKALETISAMPQEERSLMGQRGRTIVETEFNLIKGVQMLAGLFREIKK